LNISTLEYLQGKYGKFFNQMIIGNKLSEQKKAAVFMRKWTACNENKLK